LPSLQRLLERQIARLLGLIEQIQSFGKLALQHAIGQQQMDAVDHSRLFGKVPSGAKYDAGLLQRLVNSCQDEQADRRGSEEFDQCQTVSSRAPHRTETPGEVSVDSVRTDRRMRFAFPVGWEDADAINRFSSRLCKPSGNRLQILIFLDRIDGIGPG
jgi:hypothetical protein